MSYYEALEDNVPVETIDGIQWYYPKCKVCGNYIKTLSYTRKRYICSGCKTVVPYLQDDIRDTYREIQIDEALAIIGKVTNADDYKDAAKEILKEANNKYFDWYHTIEHLVLALELKRRNINFTYQYEYINYKVDFVIPSLKLILEVGRSGSISDNAKKYFSNRNKNLNDALNGYRIIKVKNDLIHNKIHKLIPLIKMELVKSNQK